MSFAAVVRILLLFILLVSPDAYANYHCINNQGDLGKTLNDLGKSDSIKSLVFSTLSAGALNKLDTALGMENITAKSTFGEQFQKAVIDNTANAMLSTAVNGGSLENNLANGLKNAFIDTAAAQGANWIGDQKVAGNLNAVTHKLAHAIAGCAAGAAKSGDCSSGALGAVVGEITAELYNSNGNGIPKSNTAQVAQLMGGLAAALTGNDVNVAAGTAMNAAANNAMLHVNEINWINAHAGEYAQQHPGMSVDQAKAELAQQALGSLDGTWASLLGFTPNADAQAFLAQAQGNTFINDQGQSQAFFTNVSGDYANALINAADSYSNPASLAFYQQYVQPGKQNAAMTGLMQLGMTQFKDGVSAMWNLPGAMLDGAKALVTNPGGTLVAIGTGMYVGMHGAGTSLGASGAAFFDPNNQQMLNALYGDPNASNLAGTIALMPATAMVGGAVLGGPVANAAGKAAGTGLDAAAASLAKKFAGDAATLKNAGNIVDQAATGIQWGKGIQGQGMPWEDYLASTMPADSRLPPNFKTFDFFDQSTGLATSAKTLDTTTTAKIANPAQVYSSIKGNIDAMVNFDSYSLSGVPLSRSQINARELQLAVPSATNPVQWEQINQAIQYGQSQGVNVVVTQVK